MDEKIGVEAVELPGRRRSRTSRVSTSAVLAVAGVLGACWPAYYDVAPEIAGTAQRGGVPAAGVPVRLGTWADSTCAAPPRTAVSDSAGAFRLARVRKRTVEWLLGPRYRRAAEWQLCAPRADSAWHMAFRYRGGAFFPEPFHCRLDVAPARPVAICTEPARRLPNVQAPPPNPQDLASR